MKEHFQRSFQSTTHTHPHHQTHFWTDIWPLSLWRNMKYSSTIQVTCAIFINIIPFTFTVHFSFYIFHYFSVLVTQNKCCPSIYYLTCTHFISNWCHFQHTWGEDRVRSPVHHRTHTTFTLTLTTRSNLEFWLVTCFCTPGEKSIGVMLDLSQAIFCGALFHITVMLIFPPLWANKGLFYLSYLKLSVLLLASAVMPQTSNQIKGPTSYGNTTIFSILGLFWMKSNIF